MLSCDNEYSCWCEVPFQGRIQDVRFSLNLTSWSFSGVEGTKWHAKRAAILAMPVFAAEKRSFPPFSGLYSVSPLLSTTFQTSRVSLGQINFGSRQSSTGKKGLISAYKKFLKPIHFFVLERQRRERSRRDFSYRPSIRIIANFNFRLFGLLYFISQKRYTLTT